MLYFLVVAKFFVITLRVRTSNSALVALVGMVVALAQTVNDLQQFKPYKGVSTMQETNWYVSDHKVEASDFYRSILSGSLQTSFQCFPEKQIKT